MFEPSIAFAQIGLAYPILEMDGGLNGTTPGGTTNWYNQTGMTRASTGFTYVTSNFGVKTDKILLTGYSMGGGSALIWAAHNPSKVAGVFVTNPALSITAIWQGTYGQTSTLASGINAAYGGTYSPTSTDAQYGGTVQSVRDAYYMSQNGSASLWIEFPITIWYGGADPFIDPASVTGFASAINAAGGNVTLVYDPMGTHSTTQSDLYGQGALGAVFSMFASV
jgi:S-formylglutathione hydrolase FrmB